MCCYTTKNFRYCNGNAALNVSNVTVVRPVTGGDFLSDVHFSNLVSAACRPRAQLVRVLGVACELLEQARQGK